MSCTFGSILLHAFMFHPLWLLLRQVLLPESESASRAKEKSDQKAVSHLGESMVSMNDTFLVQIDPQYQLTSELQVYISARQFALKTPNLAFISPPQCLLSSHPPCPPRTYSSRAKVSGRAANDPGFVKVSQNSILRISINIHCTAGELYS